MALILKGDIKKEDKLTIINFDAKDYIAIKGNEKSFFNGETKVVHKVHGQKLIDNKQATEVKGEIVKTENLTRSVKDLPKR